MTKQEYKEFRKNGLVKIHHIEKVFKQMALLWPGLFQLSYHVKGPMDFRRMQMAVLWPHLSSYTGREKVPGKEIYLTLHMYDELPEPCYIDLPSPHLCEQFGEVKAYVIKSFVPSEIVSSSRPSVTPKEWGSLIILFILK